jgi:hypothetical protein
MELELTAQNNRFSDREQRAVIAERRGVIPDLSRDPCLA